MFIFKLAWRNIFRHKIRTMLTAFTIFAGVFIAMFGNSINNGFTRFVIDQFIRTDIGVVRILPADLYQDMDDKEPVMYSISDSDDIRDFISEKFPEIKTSGRIFFMGELTDGENDIPAVFYGVDEKDDEDVFNRKKTIVRGEYFKDNSKDIIISSKIADLIGVEPGDFVTIMGKDSKKAINASEVRISGLFMTGNLKIDNSYVFMPIDLAEEFTAKSALNEIILMSSDSSISYAESIKNTLENRFGQKIDIVTWNEEISDFLSTMKMKEKSGFFFMGIIFFMAAFGIANTLIMAVYERKREIGILYALGVKRSGIIRLFVLEGTLIGIIGGVSAGFLVFFLCSYYGNAGISLNMAEEMTEALNFGGGRLFPSLSLNLTLLCVLSAIGVSALASLYPAWFATRFNPADIIRQ